MSRLYKRPGNPRRADILPRGIVAGPAMNSPWQGDAISGRAALAKGAYGGGMGDFAFAPTKWGMGARLQWTEHHYAAPTRAAGAPLTLECLFVTIDGPPAGKEVLVWRSQSGPQSARLRISSDGKFEWAWYVGFAAIITGTTVIQPGRVYHVVVTNDRAGSTETTNLYVNGVLEATSGATSYIMESFLNPAVQIGSQWGDATSYILMFTASEVAWAPDEVRARSLDPYSHLIWPEDDLVATPMWLRALNAARPFIFRH